MNADLDSTGRPKFRCSTLIEYDGRAGKVSTWAREIGMEPITLVARLNRGWSIARALTEPLQRNTLTPVKPMLTIFKTMEAFIDLSKAARSVMNSKASDETKYKTVSYIKGEAAKLFEINHPRTVMVTKAENAEALVTALEEQANDYQAILDEIYGPKTLPDPPNNANQK